MMRSRSIYFLLILVVACLAFGYFLWNKQPSGEPPATEITSYEECVAAGNLILESYPEQCRTPDGKSFTRPITDSSQNFKQTGTYVCLPKVNTGGPITLECTFGLQSKDEYYALDLSNVEQNKYQALQGNENITVEGSLVPLEMISSDRWRTYDIVGIVIVRTITNNETNND